MQGLHRLEKYLNLEDFVVTCWERADLLARLWCLLWVCHFPIGILGQVWYLIVSIPDLCTLTYFSRKVLEN